MQTQLTKTRGANIFAIDTKIEMSQEEGSKGIPMIVTRLAVGVRRKLIVFTWRDTEIADPKVHILSPFFSHLVNCISTCLLLIEIVRTLLSRNSQSQTRLEQWLGLARENFALDWQTNML